jgi:hypothetical protein
VAEDCIRQTQQAMKQSQLTMRVAFAEIQDCDQFESAWKDFAQQFHETPDVKLIDDEPELLVVRLQDDGLADALLASMAAYFCQLYSLKQPSWPDQKPRIKKNPWFAADSPELRNLYLRKSPAAFRVRNLFVSANALSRA